MKILFNISSMNKGGAERVVANLSNQLVKKHKVTIMINIKDTLAYELDSRIKVIALDKKRKDIFRRTIERAIKTVKYIKEEKPDVIISFLPVPSYRILLLKRFFKKPIIVSDRNDPNKEYGPIIRKLLMLISYPKADGFVFQTKEQKEYFHSKIQDKSTIIYNPIKEEFLHTQEREKKNVIINVGRLVEQKNQKMLINAFSRISDKYKDYKLKIFGDGPLKDALQKQIDELNLQGRVELCNISNNIKKELEEAKIFVLTSNHEGMPNALIEAMAVGLPCISTDCPCGGPRELIQDGKNGLLIPIKDEEKLQEKLEIIINSEKFRTELGENAKNIKDKVEISKIVQKWEEYIEQINKNINREK